MSAASFPPAAPLLEFRDVSRHFPSRGGGRHAVVRALDGINLAIESGTTLGILGESGCGKTTLSRIALMLDRPSGGSVLFRGKDLRELHGEALRDFRSSVQAVFQDPWSSLNPRMKIVDIVLEPVVINRPMAAAEMRRRAEELMAMVGLSARHLTRFPHELSGGQRQRVAIARALSLNPQLIVLDEPVSSLDVSIRSQMMNLLRELQAKHGFAYLLIGHHLPTVAYVSDRIAVMYLGRVVELLDSGQLIGQPKHPYTQGLLASSLPAHPRDRGRAAPIGGEVPSPIDPPAGCRFHTRCPHVMDVCRVQQPEFRRVDGGVVACHLYDAQRAGHSATPASRERLTRSA